VYVYVHVRESDDACGRRRIMQSFEKNAIDVEEIMPDTLLGQYLCQ
jgi:hypothetical protein